MATFQTAQSSASAGVEVTTIAVDEKVAENIGEKVGENVDGDVPTVVNSSSTAGASSNEGIGNCSNCNTEKISPMARFCVSCGLSFHATQ